MLWVRNVRDRLEKLAPFLSYDGDPYPVVVDGRVLVGRRRLHDHEPLPVRPAHRQRRPADAGTAASTATPTTCATASRPSSTPTTASVTLLRQRPRRPDHPGVGGRVRRPVHAAATRCRAELREHLRYPEDLFRVQTDVYSKYQLDAGRTSSSATARGRSPRRRASTRAGDDRRAAAVDRRRRRRPAGAEPSSRRSPSTSRFMPYYTMFDDAAGEGDDEFVLLRPFVPFSRDDQRTELQAYMTASSDPDTYGQLTAYVVDGDAARRAAHGGQPDRLRAVDHPADHAADRRRQPGALRRPAAGAGRRRAALRAPVLRRRAAELRPGDDGHRVPLRDRRPTTAAPRSASRSARRWPSCSRGSRATSATASAADDESDDRRRPTPTEPSPDRRRDAGRAAGRRPTSCSTRPSRRCATDGDLGGTRTNVEAGRGARATRPLAAAPSDGTAAEPASGSARALELLGQPGQVLAEGDLVAGLLVGQADLAVAELADAPRRRRRRRPAGRRGRRSRRRAR